MISIKKPEHIIDDVNKSSGVLTLLKKTANVSDVEFNDKYLKPLLSIAEWVQELPAHKLHHNDVGGAMRFCMHAGFASIRISESFIFTPSDMSEYRYELEKEFRYASYIATIFSTVAYPFSYLQVFNDDGEVWNKHLPLNSFCDKYDLRWIANGELNAKSGYFYATKLLPVEFIDKFNQIVTTELMKSLSPEPVPTGAESPMQKTVRLSIQKIIEIEQKRLSMEFSKSTIQPYIAEDIVVESTNNQTKTDTEISNKLDTESNIEQKPQDSELSNKPTGEFIKTLNRSVSEILKLLKEDLKTGTRDISKIKKDSLGLIIPSSFFSNYGLPLTKIEDELRKKGAVIKKEGQHYILIKELSDWLIEDVKSLSQDLFEKA